jgi:hypothetical protein
MTRLRLAGLVAAAIAFLPFAAGASDKDDALKLAEHMASGATVLLRAAPPQFPASIPLPNAALLGSASYPLAGDAADASRWLQSNRVVLYFDTPNRAAAMTAYEDALRAAGWKKADMTRRFSLPLGSPIRIPPLLAWCSPEKPATTVGIGLPESMASAVTLTVAVGGPIGNLACGEGPMFP